MCDRRYCRLKNNTRKLISIKFYEKIACKKELTSYLLFDLNIFEIVWICLYFIYLRKGGKFSSNGELQRLSAVILTDRLRRITFVGMQLTTNYLREWKRSQSHRVQKTGSTLNLLKGYFKGYWYFKYTSNNMHIEVSLQLVRESVGLISWLFGLDILF